MNLQEEAKKEYPLEGEDLCYVDLGLIQQDAFIAGTTSKYVEKEKLKFAIDTLYLLRAAPLSEIDNKIEDLEQQLKDLENE